MVWGVGFERAAEALIDLGAPCVGGTLADVTGDGVLDVVASGTLDTTLSIVPGKRGGGFGKPRLIEAGGQSPHLAVGDTRLETGDENIVSRRRQEAPYWSSQIW